MVSQPEQDGGISLANYQLHLPSFEGPLDLLLRLIERSQLAIADVSLVAVTDQFLARVAEMRASGAVPDETIADFAAVGARLTVLKSRSLLPRPPRVDDELPENDLAAVSAVHLAQRADRRDGAGRFALSYMERVQSRYPINRDFYAAFRGNCNAELG